MTYVSVALRRVVVERAGFRCEYCLLPAASAFFPHEVDHIIAEKHGGATTEANLAYTCWRCNRHKGSDLTTFDPLSGELIRLFNPRQQVWAEHFTTEGARYAGLTAEGRATIYLLQLNSEERRAERQASG